MKHLHGTAIEPTDGNIGSVEDVYFDDQTGRIRYYVVDTGKWLPGRKTLNAPEAIRRPWHDGTRIQLNLSRARVKSSPDIDTKRPVSRDAGLLLHNHYGWSPYWISATLPPPTPKSASSVEERLEFETAVGHTRNSHHRSCREVMGYEIRASDGKAGTLEDFLIDPEEGRIRFLAIETGEWLSHRHVVMPPERVAHLDSAESKVETNLSRDECREVSGVQLTAHVDHTHFGAGARTNRGAGKTAVQRNRLDAELTLAIVSAQCKSTVRLVAR